jgi:glyoxylase-like metal-dependent hydrolase (beta-lactamase superfamily II)
MRLPKERVIRVALAAAGAACLWLAWAQNQQPAQLTLQKISDDLYVIMGSGGNVAFMPTREGVILIDDKFAQDGPQILAKVKSVTAEPIKYVINTHQHGDHTGGNAALLAAGAEILIHKNARANMAATEMPGIPRITFSDQSQVFLGGKEVEARYFGRGHTNGDVMIYFPADKVVHTGDLFVSGAPYCDTSAGCSIKEWDKTLEKAIAAMDFDTVIPGHGPVTKKADLVKYVQTVASVREQVAKACQGGADGAAQRLDLSGLGLQPNAMILRGVPGMCKELAQ